MPYAQQPGTPEDRVAELEYKLEHIRREGDAIVMSAAYFHQVNAARTTDGEPIGLGNVIVGLDMRRTGHPSSGSYSSVSGGQNRTAHGDYNWAAQSLLEGRWDRRR